MSHSGTPDGGSHRRQVSSGVDSAGGGNIHNPKRPGSPAKVAWQDLKKKQPDSAGGSSSTTWSPHLRPSQPQSQQQQQQQRPTDPESGPDVEDRYFLCTLWVHDENFSREEVLFNPSACGDSGLKVGDLIEIAAMHSDSLDPSTGASSRAVRDGLEPEAMRAPSTSSGPGGVTSPTGGGTAGGTASASATADRNEKSRQGGFLFHARPLPAEFQSRHPNMQVSIASSIANLFGFKNRCQVRLSHADRSECTASHVELIFRDQFLDRSDMWRLAMSELVDKPVYKGQKILFMGTIRANVKSIYVNGNKARSGYFASTSRPIFRSESARFVLFIQMSMEMWDFDSEGTGDILYSRVINGFLPELFKRWAWADSHHLVTIVLFTRVEYDSSPSQSASAAFNADNLNRLREKAAPETQDFYRVVVNDMPSGQWTTILDSLKKEFRVFLRDVSIPPPRFPDDPISAEEEPQFCEGDPPPSITGRPTTALRGNILEAINVATSYLTYEHVGRDLLRTGTSIVVITPGQGVFEVPFDTLALTSDVLSNRAVGVDLICISPMPLHPVPIFKYPIPTDELSRPGSSVSKDTIIRVSSSETHESAASGSTQQPHEMPHENSGDGPPQIHPQVRQSPLRADDWGYGMPSWIDVSFWDPLNYRSTRTPLEKVSKAPVVETLNKGSTQFAPRVKMYEIQMMGVMESEQSNISIPYLPQVHATLQNPPTAMLRNRVPTEPGVSEQTRPVSPKAVQKLQLSGSGGGRAGSYMVSFKESKKNMLSAPAKQRTETLEWMDTYDNCAFSAFPKNRGQRKRRSGGKRIGELETTTEGPARDRRPARSGGGGATTSHRSSSPSPSRRGSRSSQQNAEGRGSGLKATSPAPSPLARKSIIKPPSRISAPRISRSISFALRGLGPAPRAVASTEVKAEHATGVSTTSGKTPEETPAQSPSTDNPPNQASSERSPTDTQKPENATSATGSLDMAPSRPISIKPKSAEESNPRSHPLDNSFSTATTEVPHGAGVNAVPKSSFTRKRGISKPDFGPHPSGPEPPTKRSPEQMLMPSIRPVVPWKPPKNTHMRGGWYGRWQHVYPRRPTGASVRWKSLRAPVSLPLTTAEFPTEQELATDYSQTPYRVYPNDAGDNSEAPKSRDVLLREMISIRLSRGFQFVTGKRMRDSSLGNINIFDPSSLSKDGVTIFMSFGYSIHKIVCVAGGEVEVTKFTRKISPGTPIMRDHPPSYSPAVKTILSSRYCKNTIDLGIPSEEYNWSFADAFLAGHKDHLTNTPHQLGFWRTRFVLIPVHVPVNARRPLLSYTEDNEEEIHLLGIYQLTQMWQKHRYVSPEERQFQSSTHRMREQNPLNILYQTSDPSVVVAAELDRLLVDDPGLDNPHTQLLPDSELFQKSSINLSSLAQEIQGEKGVRMMDRRWHWRLHYNCFIGLEFTSWILQNFKDINTREEAVEFGNELMKHGLFHHVQRRHNFRDGNYFYQMADEYRTARPESRAGWFQPRKVEKPVPQTPGGEGVANSPASFAAKPEKAPEETGSKSASQTPTKPGRKVAVSMAKSMKYDLDPRKRSNRSEVIDLHYDRLHNPENCFHFELSWMNATPKLVEDTIFSWMSTVEKYGLKLVEMPISESSSIVESQVFRRPYPVKLKAKPPDPPVRTMSPVTSFSSQGSPDRLYYHKALLKKFDFVLDHEAASAFPPDVEVSYPWGKADFRYPQYVHRTGAVLAQITDEGDFLILANRLFATRPTTTSKDSRPRAQTLDHASPRLSPVVYTASDPNALQLPQNQAQSNETFASFVLTTQIGGKLRSFCNDTEALERFFAEVKGSQTKPASTKASPVTPTTADSSIPTLELPGSVVPRAISPSGNSNSPLSKPRSIDALVHGTGNSSPINESSKPSPP